VYCRLQACVRAQLSTTVRLDTLRRSKSLDAACAVGLGPDPGFGEIFLEATRAGRGVRAMLDVPGWAKVHDM
jgi:hypothetical protein